MLTRTQKKEHIAKTLHEIAQSRNIVFTDFTSVKVGDLVKLKRELKAAAAKFFVVKKRLLSIALTRAGIALDANQFTGPVGTVFASGEITSVAAPLYKFWKTQEKAGAQFKILGAYDVSKKAFIDEKAFMTIAKLPSREILLTQIILGISGPLRAFMSIVKQLGERKVEAGNQLLATGQ